MDSQVGLEGMSCEEARTVLQQLLWNVEKNENPSIYAEALCQDPTFTGGSAGCAGVSVSEIRRFAGKSCIEIP